MTLALVVWCVGILASIVIGIILIANAYNDSSLLTGWIVLVGGSVFSWIGSWTLYAFGQITEDIHAMRTSDPNAAPIE